MSDVSISVVIPTYNRAALACRAVESALRQTRPADEVLVVDDGSTDDTAAQLARFGDSIRVIRQKNGGASASRNHGVEEAVHPWVAFLDSDDIWVQDHLARMNAAIASTHGAAQFYFSDMGMAPSDGGGTLWERIGFSIPESFLLTPDAADWVMMERQPTMLQSSIFRREAYRAAGGLQPRYKLVHDTHIFLIMGIGQSACAVQGCGTLQTSDDEAGTRLTAIHSSKTRGYWEENARLWEDILASVPGLSHGHAGLARSYLAHARWRLARASWREKQYAAWVRDTMQAVQAHPLTVLQIAAHALRKREM
jgi:hypothetical protein